jgi:hypothetical protein
MPVSLLAEISANKFVQKHKAKNPHFLAENFARNLFDRFSHFVAEYSANKCLYCLKKNVFFLFLK